MRTDGRTDMPKQTVAFLNFANALKNWFIASIHKRSQLHREQPYIMAAYILESYELSHLVGIIKNYRHLG
jgi:hypothetical protein